MHRGGYWKNPQGLQHDVFYSTAEEAKNPRIKGVKQGLCIIGDSHIEEAISPVMLERSEAFGERGGESPTPDPSPDKLGLSA